MCNLAEFAVLLMAYGTPNSIEEIEPYLTDIRRGGKPTPEAVQEIKNRYSKIGGRSPLLEITKAQASALEKKLRAEGSEARVYFGMKHWHPYIREVVPQIINDGLGRVICVALAPHYSQISIGGYKRAFDEANAGRLEADFVESWNDNPLFHAAVAEKVTQALTRFPDPKNVKLLFTAHSLPERILEQNDPYPNQLQSSCKAVAEILKREHWSFAYQSAGMTREKWLGPDILETLGQLSKWNGLEGVLVVPIGFVADHLEILYDIDVEAREYARSHGLHLERTESLNASPTFIDALSDVVRKQKF
jgi:ferrochelatase